MGCDKGGYFILALRFFPAKMVYHRMTPERLFCPRTLNRAPSSFEAPSSGWGKHSTPNHAVFPSAGLPPGYPQGMKLRVPCGGLTRAVCPPKQIHHSLPQLNRGGRKYSKSSSVKIRAGRNHSPITVTGKTDSAWGN